MLKQFDIILADPPWSFNVWKGKESRTADAHYKTMDLHAICELPIGSIAAPNSVLFLWSTMPCLPEAFRVMESWAYTYKTIAFTWVKLTKQGNPFVGLGHHTRGNAELVLLGVKGKGLPRVSKSISQIVMAERGRHSAKPYEVQERIEQLYGDGVSRVELFARQERPGWVCWGDELNNGVELFK